MRSGLVHGEDTTYQIIGLAMRVHSNRGPGLMESTYHKCLAHELRRAGIPFEQEVRIPLVYEGMTVDPGYVAVSYDGFDEAGAVAIMVPRRDDNGR